MQLQVRVLTSGLLSHLSWNKLGAVDELGEVRMRVRHVWHVQARQRPLLRVHLPTDLHVDNFHFLTVLQRLTGQMRDRLAQVISRNLRPFMY